MLIEVPLLQESSPALKNSQLHAWTLIIMRGHLPGQLSIIVSNDYVQALAGGVINLTNVLNYNSSGAHT